MADQVQVQASTLPPAQPAYVLRGHVASVHALQFWRANSCLLSGDAKGWVILWDVTTKRARAVWRACESSILGIGTWGAEKIIIHGRDSSLKVWQIRDSEEGTFSKLLPVEDSTSHRKEPWLLHSLAVNTLNFCAFAMCYESTQKLPAASDADVGRGSILIAVPGLQEGFVNIMQLPSEERMHTVPPVKDGKDGSMVMALRLFYIDHILHLITGQESGVTTVQSLRDSTWITQSVSHTHTQPILSLDILPNYSAYFTSGADAIIGLHTIPDPRIANITSADSKSTASTSAKTIQTKHSGQQSLTVRSDGKIFATAGWDSRVRVYSTKTMKELAVLKWHKEGCYSVAFAHIANKEDILIASPLGTMMENRITDQPEDQAVMRTGERKTARQRREDAAKEIHWLAGGSKDGKISLWEIY